MKYTKNWGRTGNHTRGYLKAGLCFLIFLLLAATYCSCAKKTVIPQARPISEAEILFAEADSQYRAGDYEGAVALYNSCLAKYPRAVMAEKALLSIGNIYLVQLRFQEARDTYERLVNEYASSPLVEDAYIGILETYYRAGDYEGAFEQAAGMAVKNLSRAGRARLFKLLGNAYLARNAVSDSVYAYGMGYYYAAGGEKMEILNLLRPAVQQLTSREIEALLSGPDFLPKGYLKYQLGVNYLAEGQTVSAFTVLNDFLTHYPDHEFSDEAWRLVAQVDPGAWDERFVIGCLLPLTGPYQAYGEKALRGIELALSRYSEETASPSIRIIVEDTGSNSLQAIAGVNALYEAQVAAIIGPIVAAKEAAEAAQANGVPIIALSGKEAISGIGDYVFRNFLTPQAQIKTIVPYLCEDLGLKRFAILYPNEKYGSTFMNLFWDEILLHGGVVTGCEPYPTDAMDFADPIKKLVGLYYEVPEDVKLEELEQARLLEEDRMTTDPNQVPEGAVVDSWLIEDIPVDEIEIPENLIQEPVLEDEIEEGTLEAEAEEEEPKAIVDFDALFIPDSPSKVGLIAPQLAYYDVENVIFIGTNLWHSEKLIKMARKYVQNGLLADGFFAESKLPHVRDFVYRYKAAYNDAPGFIEAISYDTASMLFAVMGRPEYEFRYSIKKSLMQMLPYPGVTGETVFSETGEAEKQLYLLKIKGGRFHSVTRTSTPGTQP